MLPSFVVIIVTYNRLEKLKKSLHAYAQQTYLPTHIVVVDNASSDGTADFLNNWKIMKTPYIKKVITLTENLGGSGGFYYGEKEALKMDVEWILVSDDDAYPCKNYLEGMSNYIRMNEQENISIICGKVMEHGSSVNIHRSFWRSKWDTNFHTFANEEMYQKAVFYPDFVSYVGVVIKRNKLKQVGLVDYRYFIWCDDTEHAYRLSKVGKIVCLPKYTMYHDIDYSNSNLSWKSFYGYRNNLIFFRKHFPYHFPMVLISFFCKTILTPLIGRSLAEVKMRFIAMKDSVYGTMGKHEVYQPGWKP